MSRRTRRGGRGRRAPRRAGINMDSLIDLTFLLLVTFMLTIPALEQGISIMLPRARTDTLPSKNGKANTITLDYNNRLFFNDAPTTTEDLEAILTAKVAEDPDVPVLVRGDERLEYGAVMDVVKVVYKCKVHRMALVTVEK
ncbi:MAG: ExbD/TolR family protein [Kiritimatiellia bacterium]